MHCVFELVGTERCGAECPEIRVCEIRDPEVENQLKRDFHPQVHLSLGGYISEEKFAVPTLLRPVVTHK